LCIVALLLVALYFCWPTIFSGKYLVGGDTIQWRATAQSMIEHREATGEEPLWATNVFGGMPGVMISQPPRVFQIDHLPAWLRLISWPFSHAIVLLLGAYALVCYLTKEKILGLFAACAYGLTTYLPVILVAGHNTKYIALAYAPWMLLSFVYVLRRPGILASLLFAVAVAVSLRAGHVQIPYYVGMICLVWWIGALVWAIKNAKLKEFGWTTLWLALGTLLALLMVAQAYWPTYEYKAYTIRGMASGGGEGALGWGYAMNWSQGWSELATLLIADAFGGSGQLYWGPKPFTGGPHYVGGVVLLLAGLAVWRLRTWAVGALAIAAGLMTLFSLGSNFESLSRVMFAYFPFFDAFRAPETWLIAVALALAVLAALGLGYVTSPELTPRAEAGKTRAVYVALGCMVGLLLLLYVGKDSLFSFERSGEREQVRAMVAQQIQRPASDSEVIRAADGLFDEQLVKPRKEAWNGDAQRTLLFVFLAAVGLILFRRKKIPAWTLQWLLAILLLFDLGGVARRYFSEDHLSIRRDAASRVPTYDVDRFLLDKKEEKGGAGNFRVLSTEVADPARDGRPSFHHESLGGYSGAKLRLYQDFLEHILLGPTTGQLNGNALDMMNARYVISRTQIPGMEVVYRGNQLMVLENPDALPRATVIGEVEVISSAEDTWARLLDPSFDPSVAAILDAPLDTDTDIVPIDSGSIARVTMDRYGPREMALTVETDQPRLLLLSEIYYPVGWHAMVSGETAPIYRTNYLLRAVPVPAGIHEVVLRFDPISHTVGNWISIIATLLAYLSIFVLVGYTWYRRRQ